MAARIQQTGNQVLDPKQYNQKDLSLVGEFLTPSQFDPNTDTVEYYVYDINNNLLSYAPEYAFFSILQPDNSLENSTNTISINIENDLKRRGYEQGTYQPVYNFFKNQLESSFRNRFFIKEISPSRTEIRLANNFLDDSTLDITISDFISQRNSSEYFEDFFLNFGDNIQLVANNIILDTTDPDDFTVLIKLYNPLPPSFSINDTLWIATEVADPRTFLVEFEDQGDEEEDGRLFLRGPNLNIEIKDEISNATTYKTLNDLLDNTQLTSSYNQLQNILDQKGISINLDYGLDTTKFENFTHFSSAEQRIKNFHYKISLIESTIGTIANLTSLSGTSNVSSSLAENEQTIKDTIKSFDGFENFMYYNSSSVGTNGTTWPKTGLVAPYSLQSTSSAEVSTWYNRILTSASIYDQENSNNLIYAIPDYLRDDPANAPYELFIEMIGQYFDQLYFYVEDITNKHNADNRLNFGISKDLVADVLKSFGIKLYENNFSSNDLYASLLGINASGSLLPPTGSELVTTFVTASNNAIPLNDVNKETYKRIYHNMPYLLKKKGTVEGVRALINLFGIPDTILRISEFGGKDKNNTTNWDYVQNERGNYIVVSGSKPTHTITSSFIANPKWESGFPHTEGEDPESILFRFKPNSFPTGSEYKIVAMMDNAQNPINGAFSDPTRNVAILLSYTGSHLESGSYSGSVTSSLNKTAKLSVWYSASNSNNPSLEVDAPFYNGNWWAVQLSKDGVASTTATLRIAESIYNGADGFQVGFTASDSVQDPLFLKDYGSASAFYLPASSHYPNITRGYPHGGTVKQYLGISGSYQEYRLYNQVISEKGFLDYAMNPNSIEGLYPTSTSSTDYSSNNNLFFRAPLGRDLNQSQGTVVSIHPKITGSTLYVTNSFSGSGGDGISTYHVGANTHFKTQTEFTYYDQPAAGIKNRISNKIKLSNNLTASGDVLTPYASIRQYPAQSESYTRDINYIEVAFSPQNEINDDINSSLGYFNIGEYIGDPRTISSSATSYADLDNLRFDYFKKYYKPYNWIDYIRIIKYFDNSLFKMIKDFVPAKSNLSSGVVIKQHLLERNRQQPAQVSFEEISYTGSITSSFITGGDGGVFSSLPYSVTQTWTETVPTLIGNYAITRNDKSEFLSGELSGSQIEATDGELSSGESGSENVQPFYLNNRLSTEYMDADYSSDIKLPQNISALASGSALKASVQDSNYSTIGIINGRYNGTKVTSTGFNQI